jgi:hypothetical protein
MTKTIVCGQKVVGDCPVGAASAYRYFLVPANLKETVSPEMLSA